MAVVVAVGVIGEADVDGAERPAATDRRTMVQDMVEVVGADVDGAGRLQEVIVTPLKTCARLVRSEHV